MVRPSITKPGAWARWKPALVWGGVLGAALLLFAAADAPARRMNVLKAALKDDDSKAVLHMVQNGLDPRTTVCTEYNRAQWTYFIPLLPDSVAPRECRNWSPLIVEAAQMEPAQKLVGELLKRGADASASDTRQQTALGNAVEQDDLATAQILLAHGVDPNAVGSRGAVPLFAAVKQGNVAMVRLLLAHGAKRSLPQIGGNLLWLAAAKGDTKTMRVLLQQGVYVDAPNIDETALMAGVTYEHPEGVAFLLAHGANVQAKDGNGDTPLAYALNGDRSSVNPAVVRLLLRSGASLFTKNAAGQMPLDKLDFVQQIKFAQAAGPSPSVPPYGSPPYGP